MRKFPLILFGATLIGGCLLVAWAWRLARYPVRNAPSAGRVIVAFGDSLVSGAGVNPGEEWPALLSTRLARPIMNAGVAGDTTALALARLNKVQELHPDLVIVLLGGNDALQRVPPDQTVANLRQIIARLQDDGAVVLLVGVRGGIIGDPYHRKFAKLARETDAAYVPNILDSVLGNDYLMADELHPNFRGQRVMAERLLPTIQWLLGQDR
ncbi:MAG: arylesterase [bacterium]|nr:arylesterase [bacterium]